MAKPGIGGRARHHGHGCGERILNQRYAGQPEGVVGKIERDQRHEPHECNEAPPLALYTLDDLLKPAADPPPDPIPCQIARDDEGQDRPHRTAGKIKRRAPDRPE